MEILRDYNKIPLMAVTKEHLEKKIPFSKPILRPGSELWGNFIDEVRNLIEYGFIKLDEDELELINSDIGEKSIYENNEVDLEIPRLIFTDSLSNKSLYEVYVKNNNITERVYFTDINETDDLSQKLSIREMFYIKDNTLLLESIGENERCVNIAKSKFKVYPSIFSSSSIVKCIKGEIWKNNLNESFFTGRLNKFKDIPKIKSKRKLIELFKEYSNLNLNDINSEEEDFLKKFNIELLILKELSKCDINKSDLDLLKLYSSNNNNYKKFEEYVDHPLNKVLDWDIEESTPEEKVVNNKPNNMDIGEISLEERKKRNKLKYFLPSNSFPYYGEFNELSSDGE